MHCENCREPIEMKTFVIGRGQKCQKKKNCGNNCKKLKLCSYFELPQKSCAIDRTNDHRSLLQCYNEETAPPPPTTTSTATRKPK